MDFEWLSDLFAQGSVAGEIFIISMAVAAGMAIGKVSVKGLRLGVGGALFAGLILGHFHLVPETGVLHFAREFGLILFVYAIGLQVGPAFFRSLEKQGLRLNLLALLLVSLGTLTAVAVGRLAGLPVHVFTGLLTGAVTNTPSLGAAQQTLLDQNAGDAALELCGLAYAAAYPLAIVGIISSLIFLRRVFRVDLKAELAAFEKESGLSATPRPRASELTDSPEHTTIIPVFLGICTGIVLGSIPLYVPGIPAPVKLGLAAGPLIIAIIQARLGRIGPMPVHVPQPANDLLRDLGIAMFLSCVGLKSGERFSEVFSQGDGWLWMGLGVLVTVIPVLIVGVLARLVFRLNFVWIMGLVSGGMTDPPALAYSNEMAGNESPAVAYAAVYPLTMLLRVMSVQLIILLAAGA